MLARWSNSLSGRAFQFATADNKGVIQKYRRKQAEPILSRVLRSYRSECRLLRPVVCPA
jgi:hypothetical protein